jgi:hypothetical protein
VNNERSAKQHHDRGHDKPDREEDIGHDAESEQCHNPRQSVTDGEAAFHDCASAVSGRFLDARHERHNC